MVYMRGQRKAFSNMYRCIVRNSHIICLIWFQKFSLCLDLGPKLWLCFWEIVPNCKHVTIGWHDTKNSHFAVRLLISFSWNFSPKINIRASVIHSGVTPRLFRSLSKRHQGRKFTAFISSPHVRWIPRKVELAVKWARAFFCEQHALLFLLGLRTDP